MFTRSDSLWLSQSVQEIYAAGTGQELSHAALNTLHRRFALPVSSCEEMGLSGASYIAHVVRHAAPPPADYVAFIHDHPVIPWLSSLPPVLKLGDIVRRTDWEKTDCYNGIARAMGYVDQFILRLQATPTIVAVSVYRDVVFERGETELIALLQPHLDAAWRRVSTPRRALSDPGELHLHLTAAHRIFRASPSEIAVLRAYFPGVRPADVLPTELDRWARWARAELRRDPVGVRLRAFVTRSLRGRLFVRYFPRDGDAAELRMTEQPASPDFRQLQERGLTPRECEVLYWVAEGKRDQEIAQLLAIARRTVSKHIEHVLQRLGAENRTSAVSIASGWLQDKN